MLFLSVGQILFEVVKADRGAFCSAIHARDPASVSQPSRLFCEVESKINDESINAHNLMASKLCERCLVFHDI